MIATDIGPTCDRCKGTIWTYRGRVATCVGCRMVEGPLPVTPATPAEAREAHTLLRAEAGQ